MKAALVVALVLVGAVPAHAQTIEHGHELYLRADFGGAARTFDAVLDRTDLTPDVALAAHLHLTVLRRTLGEEDRAMEHARAAMAIDPSAALPEGAGPEAEALLERARDELGNARAGLTLEAEGESVVARLDPAPRLLAAELRLGCGVGDARQERSGPPPEVVLVPGATGGLPCTVEARTGAGAVLLALDRQLTLGGAAEETDEDDESTGAPSWPWILGGTAVAVAAGVIIAVVLVTSADGGVQLDETTVVGW